MGIVPFAILPRLATYQAKAAGEPALAFGVVVASGRDIGDGDKNEEQSHSVHSFSLTA